MALLRGLRFGFIEISGVFPDRKLRIAPGTTATRLDLGMPVIFSRACEYAIRGLIEMARHPEQINWKIRGLAEKDKRSGPVSRQDIPNFGEKPNT